MKNNIRSERVKCDLTAAQLAENIGVSESTVTAWESGKRDITIPALVQMAGIFSCTTDYLLGLTEERVAGRISVQRSVR